MQIIQSTHFAKAVLQKQRRLRWDFLLLALLFVLLQLAEWLTAALLLWLRQAEPASLLTENSFLWRTIQMMLYLSGGLLWLWVSWGLWLRCTRAAGMVSQNTSYAKRRALLLALESTLIRTILLQGVTLCLFGAYRLAELGTHHAESAPWLFGAVQLVVAAVLFLLLWSYVSLGLCCVPFVWFDDPTLPLWRVPLVAMRVMRGGRKELLLLLGWYGIQMLPLVTIPWILPRAGVALCVFFHIRIAAYHHQKEL